MVTAAGILAAQRRERHRLQTERMRLALVKAKVFRIEAGRRHRLRRELVLHADPARSVTELAN